MPLYSTLYYPHAGISNVNLIHNALLLWEEVQYISPFLSFDESMRESDKDITLAKDLLVRPYVPSYANKRLAHEILIEPANSDLPEWFFYESDEPHYSIYSQKLMESTWRGLLKSKLAKSGKGSHGYIVSPAFGLTVMAILAEVCAGTQKRTITDMESAYAGLTRYITKTNDGTYAKNDSGFSNFDKLITISLELIDVNKIPIKKLINFRKKEFQTGGSHYTNLRHNI